MNMSKILTTAGVAVILLSAFQIFLAPALGSWFYNTHREYIEDKQQQESRQQEIEYLSSLAEFEAVCDRVSVFMGGGIGLQNRAKAGVSRELGLKVCGSNAFNTGGEVYLDSPPNIAIGINARAQ